MSARRIFTDFSGWTSAHGIPHIGSTQNTCLRLFWSIIFVASSCMFTFQMVLLVQKYTSFDVTVQTELKFEERQFPAVTLCNLNPFRKSTLNLSEAKEVKDLMLNYEKAIKGDNSKYDLTDKWKFRNLTDTISIRSQARDHLLYLIADMSEDVKKKLSYTLKVGNNFAEGFIKSCAFNAKGCEISHGKPTSEFAVRNDPIYGRCFTFNFKGNHESKRAGPLYGLRVLAVSNQDEYLALTESAGIRIAVHGHDEEPFTDAFGYNAAAGFTTSFGIKYVKTKRLGGRYSNCTDNQEGISYYYDSNYQVEGCFRSCFQNVILDACGCGDPRFNLPLKKGNYCEPFVQNGSLELMSPGRKCANKLTSSSASSGAYNVVKQCACPQPCTESTYAVTVSAANFPSSAYTPPGCKDSQIVQKPWGNGGSKQDCIDWFKDNTILLEVFYERMNYQLLKESEAYTMVNLVSDMGGQLGLWMGVSVITMVEFIFLCILMCMHFTRKRNNDVAECADDDVDMSDKNGKSL